MLISAMTFALARWTNAAVFALLGTLCLALHSDAVSTSPARLSIRMQHLPSTTLWAWERAEDLHAVDPAATAIAYLDQTILLGTDVVRVRRRQPLIYPSNATLIAVARIEAPPGAILDVPH